MPWMWLIAGPNGSGKTSAVDGEVLREIAGQDLRNLNPDEATRKLLNDTPGLQRDRANLLAAQQTDSEVDALIEARHSFSVETVLSTDKYRTKVLTAKARGFNVGLIYVTLASPDLNVERVSQRVQLGGHGVPADKIISRWEKSMSNLPWFVEHADYVLVFDNSAPGSIEGPALVATKTLGGSLQIVSAGINQRIEDELASLL